VKWAKFLVVIAVLCTGCASKMKLNKQEDYFRATNSLLSDKPLLALSELPQTEDSGFIYLSEKSWLSLVSGEPLPSKQLKQMGDNLPTKETVVVSDEISHYFYQQTPEGYFPAEHEVIFFHIVNAMVFLRGENFEAAGVEARKAAFFLQDDYVQHAGGFDSAHLRVWLAATWTALGEWDKAQVDLRNAAKLSEDFEWAAELAKRQRPPKNLSVVLQGTGAEPKHDPSGLDEHLTGKGSVHFREEPLGQVQFQTAGSTTLAADQPTTLAHYKRHLDRNDQIRDVLAQSDYMMTSSLVYTGGAVAKVGGLAAAGAIITTGLIIGGSLIVGSLYLASEVDDPEAAGEIIGLGIGVGVAAISGMWGAGTEVTSTVNSSVDRSTKKTLDIARTYRFVRYIPSKVHLHWGDEPIGASVKKPKKIVKDGEEQVPYENKAKPLAPFLAATAESSRVQFFYSPL
jgi:hypothetical protein